MFGLNASQTIYGLDWTIDMYKCKLLLAPEAALFLAVCQVDTPLVLFYQFKSFSLSPTLRPVLHACFVYMNASFAAVFSIPQYMMGGSTGPRSSQSLNSKP